MTLVWLDLIGNVSFAHDFIQGASCLSLKFPNLIFWQKNTSYIFCKKISIY